MMTTSVGNFIESFNLEIYKFYDFTLSLTFQILFCMKLVFFRVYVFHFLLDILPSIVLTKLAWESMLIFFFSESTVLFVYSPLLPLVFGLLHQKSTKLKTLPMRVHLHSSVNALFILLSSANHFLKRFEGGWSKSEALIDFAGICWFVGQNFSVQIPVCCACPLWLLFFECSFDF